MVHEWYMGDGTLVVHGRYMGGTLGGTWVVHEWYMSGTWVVHGFYMDGTWMVHGWYMGGTWVVHGWYSFCEK